MTPPRDATELPAQTARAAGPRGESPPPSPAEPDNASAPPVAVEVRWEALERAVAAMRAVSIDELNDEQLGDELQVLERACRKLQARQSRLAAARAERARRRAAVAAEQAGRPGHAAGERAARRAERDLSNELGWSPGESKRHVAVGGQLGGDRPVGRALDGGELTSRHASVLADTLRWIVDPDRRDELETRLVVYAREQDPVTFGRTCHRLLAELDAEAAGRADHMRHQRRTGSARQTEDGMVELRSRVAGVDGELLMTAWHAFRRPDAPGESRTREQAGADALVAMARAALDAGTAPTRHGVRPHITVHLDWRAIARQEGYGEGALTGPLPLDQIRRLLADCTVSPLLLDRPAVALEAGQAVRTVNAGTRRIVEARDGGCIGLGCDVPAAWCQVMHLETPYRLDGRLTPRTAALGCIFHHVAFDRHGWVITWQRGRPILHHPDRPPPSGPEPIAAGARPSARSEALVPETSATAATAPDTSATSGLPSGADPPARTAGGTIEGQRPEETAGRSRRARGPRFPHEREHDRRASAARHRPGDSPALWPEEPPEDPDEPAPD